MVPPVGMGVCVCVYGGGVCLCRDLGTGTNGTRIREAHRSWSQARRGRCCEESGNGWPPVLPWRLAAALCSSALGSGGVKSSWAMSAGHCIGAFAGVLSPMVCSVGVLLSSEMGVALGLIGVGGAACQILKSSLPPSP